MRKVLLPLVALALYFSTTAPADADVRSWAMKWHHQAVLAEHRVNPVRAAYLLSPLRHPDRVRGDWYASGRYWRDAARKMNAEYRRRWAAMTDPGGSGAARWAPLIRYYWPDHLVAKAVWVVKRESGGSPRARNPSSGAAGLFQLLPAPEGWWQPAINVRKAYIKYRAAGGWSPWASCGA